MRARRRAGAHAATVCGIVPAHVNTLARSGSGVFAVSACGVRLPTPSAQAPNHARGAHPAACRLRWSRSDNRCPTSPCPISNPRPTAAVPPSKTAKLSSFKGKQSVVVAFFPAAFSPGLNDRDVPVPGQLRAIRRQQRRRLRRQRRFHLGEHGLPRADEAGLPPAVAISSASTRGTLGMLDENSGMARRFTFVVDDQGIVRHIDMAADALDPDRRARRLRAPQEEIIACLPTAADRHGRPASLPTPNLIHS